MKLAFAVVACLGAAIGYLQAQTRPQIQVAPLGRSCQQVWKRDQAADRDFFDLIPLT